MRGHRGLRASPQGASRFWGCTHLFLLKSPVFCFVVMSYWVRVLRWDKQIESYDVTFWSQEAKTDC